MFKKNTSVMSNIYDRLRYTVSWLQIQNRIRLIAELDSIHVVKTGSKVHPILYDTYDCKWDRNDNVPICDMV
jgi:hypothetical protein